MSESLFLGISVSIVLIVPLLAGFSYHKIAKRSAASARFSSTLLGWLSTDLAIAVFVVLVAAITYLDFRWFHS